MTWSVRVSSSVALRHGSHERTAVRAALSVSALVAVALATAVPSLAQSTLPRKRPAAAPSTPASAQSPQGPFIAVISIANQRVTIYNRHGVVMASPVSTGRRGFETPEGVFSIIEKKEEHYSNLYDDAPMPFMQRITWSGVAMHAGSLPGYPASHGCIRLPHAFAERLFGMTRLNIRVVVAPTDIAPLPISHAALFQPRLPGEAPLSTAPVESEPLPQSRPPRLLRTDDGPASPMMLGVRPRKPAMPEKTALPTEPQRAVVSVLEAAQAQKAAAARKAADAAQASDLARLAVKAKHVEAAKAERAAKAAEGLIKRAEARAAAAERSASLARTEEALEKANTAYEKAREELAQVLKAAEERRAAALARAAEAREALASVKTADAERVAAAAEAALAARRTEPISVFVSRRQARLYVRQGRTPVFDMPIAIKDPTRPIGTHVFTAIEETQGGQGVRWNVVTIEGQGAAAPLPQPGRRGQQAAPPPRLASVNPGRLALDRIEFPQGALERITPYVQLGSSLIVSDLGLSIETGRGTDFVVLTRGEQQAAVSIAKFVAEQKQKLAEQRRIGTRRN
jgi:lipoprotein-anchoring transpeptidase ErfK/SrfK